MHAEFQSGGCYIDSGESKRLGAFNRVTVGGQVTSHGQVTSRGQHVRFIHHAGMPRPTGRLPNLNDGTAKISFPDMTERQSARDVKGNTGVGGAEPIKGELSGLFR